MRRCLLWSLIPLCLKVMNFLRMPRTGLSCPAPPPYPTLTVPSKVCLCVSSKALNLSSAYVVASFGCEYFSSGFPNLMMAGHEQFLLGARVGLLAHTATRQALRFEYDQFLKNKRSVMWDITVSYFLADHTTPCGRIHWASRWDAIRLCRLRPNLHLNHNIQY